MTSNTTTELLEDDATAVALREAGLPVSEGLTDKEAFRAYSLQAQSAMRKLSLDNEKKLKGVYLDWVFKSLNLSHHR